MNKFGYDYNELKQMEKHILDLLPQITIENVLPENAVRIVYGDLEERNKLREYIQIQYYRTIGGDQYCVKMIHPQGTSTYAYTPTDIMCAEKAVEAVCVNLRNVHSSKSRLGSLNAERTFGWYVEQK